MNFDFGEVLTRGWQITWKHKVLWVFAMLPFVTWIFYLPLFLIAFPIIISNGHPSGPFWDFIRSPGFDTIFAVGMILITLVAFVIQLFGNSAMTLGAIRAEAGQEKQNFRDVFKSSLPYVGRIFGVMFLIGVATLIFFVVFVACMGVVSAITFGIGSIFLQFLMYPIMFVVWIVMEQSQAAIVADEMSATEALGRAWDLLTSHIWKFLLIGVLVYIAQAIVSGIVTAPMLLPLWFVIFNSAVNETLPSTNILLVSMLCMVAMLPFYVVIMGISKTFIRSTFVVTYQRLTRDSQARQELLKAIASKETK
jgi:hypothetical protein